MPHRDINNVDVGWFREALIFVMTILGVAASYAYKVLNGEKFSMRTFILQAIVAIFAGALVFLAASYYQWVPELAGGMAGFAGWSGAELIKTIEKRILKRISND